MYIIPTSTISAAGTSVSYNIQSQSVMNNNYARNMNISNTHATGKLLVKFSRDGTSYTSYFTIPAATVVLFTGITTHSITVDADTNGTTYSIAAW